MKKTIFLFVAFAFSFAANELNAQAENPSNEKAGSKAFLLDYYEETADALKDNIQGLSAEQMHYKPAKDEWSVAQCVEHIILTEEMLFNMAKELMKKPANPERKAEIKTTAKQLITGITDRSQKAQAPEVLQPSGKYDRPETAIEDFKAQRAKILAFLETVSAKELHKHIGDTPVGAADAYQSFLFIAGHTARHTLQIEEVKADAGFPKE